VIAGAVHRRVDLPPYAFWESRAGRGTPVVLIHGLGGSSDWWRHNFDALAERHTVAAVDLVGFGRNRFFLRPSRLPLAFEEIAALLGRWIETSFGGERVHLVGNSMGGHVAIHLAAERPELVRSLVLVSSTGIPFELDPRIHLQNLFVPQGIVSFSRIMARDAFRAGPTSLFVAFSRLLRDDARPLLRTLTMPVLLLWGERDPLVPLSYARQIAGLVPQARLVTVPGAAHVPMWERPELFNRELIAFLDQVDGAPSPAPRHPAFSWGLSGWTDGIAHRESGGGRDLVLVHGLGMSSRYFDRFARALHARGWSPVAVDLPGFGESLDGPPSDPLGHARILGAWGEKLGIRDAVWIGHSTGCNAVAHLAAARPDLVRTAVMLSPIWSAAEHPVRRLTRGFLVDVLREPLSLYPVVAASYWRTGIARWWRTLLRCVDDLRSPPPLARRLRFLAAARDPLLDAAHIRSFAEEAALDLPGAHAGHYSHPEETADAVGRYTAAHDES
jgi:pimeloyl-ACP methyl ester carboxylesterase